MKAPMVLREWILTGAIIAGILSALPATAQRPLAVDVSSYQGSADKLGATNINWPTVKSSGIAFTMIKAAEATRADGYIDPDPDFVYNITQAKAAGVIAGAYYYAHPELDTPDVASAYFWGVAGNYIKADGLSLMPMLDFEQDVTSANPAFTSTTLSAWLNNWCQDIVGYGKTNGVKLIPLVYTFPSYATGTAGYGPALDGTVTQWPLWMATYSGNPQTGAPSLTPWSTWAFWQYTDAYSDPGISGGVDGDVFNGTLAQMKASYVVMPTGPNITVQPSSTVAYAGSLVTMSVTATSTNGTIHYQWAKNGTNLSGANSATFTTPATIASAGSYYSVTVTNTNGVTVSSNAYLSIKTVPTNGPASIVVTNLVDWWPGDGNLLDIIGTATGKPQGILSYATGKVGSAIHFDGTTTVITTGAADLPLPWTVSLWVNYTHTPQNSAGLFENGTNSLKLEQYNGTHEVGISIVGVNDFIFSSGYSVPVNTWTHLAFVGTNTGISLYANGVLKGTLTNTFALPRNYIGGGYYLGSGEYLDFLQGNLDEIMVFNKALTSTQINAIFSAGVSGVVKAPQIMSAKRTGSDQFTVGVRGLIGKNYLVYSSPDLATWTLLGSLVNTLGTNQFFDNNVNGNSRLFYHVSQSY